MYELLISKETFYKANRFILITGIFLSFLLPFVPTPETITVGNTVINSHSLLLPSQDAQSLHSNMTSEVNEGMGTTVPNRALEKQHINTIPFELIIKSIYSLGFLIFLSILLFRITKLIYLINKYKLPRSNIISLSFSISPCSFFKYIIINEAIMETKTKDFVLKHESVHIKEWHTIDIIIAELLVVIQWFNPFAWMYRKSVETNLEYIVDQEIIKENKIKKEYQYKLLQLSTNTFPLSVVTYFSNSLIKKRIQMMNTKKSSISKTWKYLLFIPIICLSVFLLNPIVLSSNSGFSDNSKNLMFIISADASEDDLNYIIEETKQYGYSIEFSDLVWDQDKTLEKIKIEVNTGIGINTEFTDINRHHPIVIYICPDGNHGSVNEGALTEELVSRYKTVFENSDEDLVVLSSFAKKIKGLENFIHSDAFDKQKRRFSKEANYEYIFKNDVLNHTSSFQYFLDGHEFSAVDLDKKMKMRDIKNIYVYEFPSRIAIMQVHSEAYEGYQMDGATVRLYYNEPFHDFIKTEHKSISEACSQDSKIVYLLNGEETENIQAKLDSARFDKFYIQHGRNFDEKGNFLGHEIRVNHLQK